MEMNIGGKKDERALAVYEAFSQADEKYVDEMLSDETARRIRAANRRKAMGIKGTVAAIAAVFAIVVGVSIIPHGKLDSATKSADNAAAESPRNDARDAKGDEAVKNKNAEKVDAAPEMAQEATTTAAADEGAKQEAEYFDNAEEAADNAPEATASDERPGDHASGDTIQGFSSEKKDDTKTAEEEHDTRLSTGAKLEFKNGSKWYVGEYIDLRDCGKLISQENGYTVYELKGFDPEYMVALVQDGYCFAAITADIRKDTLSELSKGLNFKTALRCEYFMTDDGREEINDEVFRQSAVKILTDHADSYKLFTEYIPASGLGAYGNYVCSICSEDETFIAPVYLMIHEDTITVSCYNEVAMYTSE